MAISNSTDRFNGALAALAIKVPCVAVTNAPITLNAEQTVNGVAVVSLDRVLVKDQANQIENGIYVVSSSDWDRAPDWDGNRDVTKRTIIVCGRSGGASNVMYQQDEAGTIRVGTDATTFSTFFDPDAGTQDLQDVTTIGNFTDTGIILQGSGAAAGTLTQRDATDTDEVQLFLDGTDYNIQAVSGVVDFDIGLNATGLMNFHRPITTAFGLADRVYGNFGDLTPGSVSIGASADADHIVAVLSSTAGDQVGFVAQASVGANQHRVFFGVHDADVWGLAAWGTSNPTEFIIESGGESIIEATYNGSTRLYGNNTLMVTAESALVRVEAAMSMLEQTAAPADVPGRGQFWVKDDAPNVPMFTDDDGTDFPLIGGVTGAFNTFNYVYDTLTTGAGLPAGEFRINNGNFQGASSIHINDVDADGNDISAVLADMIFGGQVRLYDPTDPGNSYWIWSIDSVTPTDNTTYWTIGIDYVLGDVFPSIPDGTALQLEFLYDTNVERPSSSVTLGQLAYLDEGRYKGSGSLIKINPATPPSGGRLQLGTTSGLSTTSPQILRPMGAADTIMDFIYASDANNGLYQFYRQSTTPDEMGFGARIASVNTDLLIFDLSANVIVSAAAQFKIGEKGAAGAALAAYGEVWNLNNGAGELIFTDDVGADFPLSQPTVLWNAGNQKIQAGAALTSFESNNANDPAAGATQDVRLRLQNTAAETVAEIGFNSVAVLEIDSFVSGGGIEIRALDADVALFYAALEVARTKTAVTGGFEVNNTQTGGGFERVLTQSDTARAATTANFVEGLSAINKAADKVAGFMVFNTTTGAPVWATGNAATDVWNDATGATAHTPVITNHVIAVPVGSLTVTGNVPTAVVA